MQGVTVVDHPLVQHKLTLMRDIEALDQGLPPAAERDRHAALLRGDARPALEMIDIETPLQPMKAPVLAGKKLVFAPILRAGVGFLDGMLSLVPSARVAHVGLYRDPKTLVAVEYYFKAPEDVADRLVLVLDPMLATANSAIAAVDRLKEAGAKNIRIVCLLAAPEGIEKFHGHHPEVHIWTAAIDEQLNDHGYIVPGLGDAGDRMYGTK